MVNLIAVQILRDVGFILVQVVPVADFLIRHLHLRTEDQGPLILTEAIRHDLVIVVLILQEVILLHRQGVHQAEVSPHQEVPEVVSLVAAVAAAVVE